MEHTQRKASMRKTKKRALPVWLLGLAGPPAKRVRAALNEGLAMIRFEPRDIPGQSEFDREEPLAVFVDLALWRAIRAGDLAEPTWFRTARRILVDSGDGAPADPTEVLAQGFLACVTPPLTRSKLRNALASAQDSAVVFSDIAGLIGEAMRERDHLVQENGRLAFFQHMLERTMQTLDLPLILSQVLEDLRQVFPVSEVLGVFWEDDSEAELVLPATIDDAARGQRVDYLLELATRLRGEPSGSYRIHGAAAPADLAATPVEPGRALLVPLRQGKTAFGCLAVLIHRDLAKHEQETARQAIVQLSPSLRHALSYLRLKRRADRDGLTGLANRRSFDARMSSELKRHMRHREGFSLLMCDLDHFKAVNDTHGHLAGDAVLRQTAQSMEAMFRTTDFAARYGGEEFAILLPHTGQAQAWMLAERLRRHIAAMGVKHAGREIPVTISIGLVSFAPGDAVTEASLLAEADRALYLSKNSGRNRVSIAANRRDRQTALPAAQQAG